MSARAFKCIGENIFDYFKPKTYDLNRTIAMKVNANPVKFELEQSVDDENNVSAKLKACHEMDREHFSVETCTDCSPEFKVSTDRINKLKTTFGYKDPKVSTKFCYAQKKVHANFEVAFDWKQTTTEATLDVAYEQGDKLTLGGKAEVARNGEGAIDICGYGLAVEFRRNDTQKFAIKTEDRFSTISLGSEFGFRKGYTGFAQVDVSIGAKSEASAAGTDVAWAVGLQKEITDNSGARALYRGSDGTGSIGYMAKGKAFEAKLAYNFDVARLGEPGSIQYKLIFGQ